MLGAGRITAPAASSRAQQPSCLVATSSTCRQRGPQPCRAAEGTSTSAAATDAATSSSKAAKQDLSWGERGVPSYLQSSYDLDCELVGIGALNSGELLWQAIRREAQKDADSEPMLSSFLYASVLAHDSFARSLAFVLANRLANTTLLSTQLFEVFLEVLTGDENVRTGALADIIACRERDPSCRSYSQALLYFKGYHAIQAQRIAHCLWSRKQKVMALALQSRISEVLAVDIHPAATIGKGVLLDHGTGVVIGETAVIGNNVSLLQNVTLGGTGKETGDRHPKVADNVLIGASATILGNIRIGKGAQIAAGSLVLKPVPPHTLVAGSPAKEVGQVVGNPARTMVHWSKRLMAESEGAISQMQVAAQQPPVQAAAPVQVEPHALLAAALESNSTAAPPAAQTSSAASTLDHTVSTDTGNGSAQGQGHGDVSTAPVQQQQQQQQPVVSTARAPGSKKKKAPGSGGSGQTIQQQDPDSWYMI